MFQGKNLHYSPIDLKPLCSYSGKLCKQRRINGFAFCIRHILEDKSSPFKQCSHVAKYNNQKCTNPIPSNEDRQYCNSHMQAAGMLPKKERKEKSGSSVSNHLKSNSHLNTYKVADMSASSATAVGIKSNSVAASTNTVSISVSSSPLMSAGSGVASTITTSLGSAGESTAGGGGGLKITIPNCLNTSSTVPSSSFSTLNCNANKHIINEKLKLLISGELDLMRMRNAASVNGRSTSITSSPATKKSDNTITISITSMNTNHGTTSSHPAKESTLNVSKEKNTKAAKSSKESSKKSCTKKRKKLNLSKLGTPHKVVYAIKKERKNSLDDLFNYDVYSSSEEEESREGKAYDCIQKSYPMVTMSRTLDEGQEDFEISELRSQLISQKWLLSNLVKLKENDLREEVRKVRREIKRRHLLERTHNLSYTDVLLESKERLPSRVSSEALRRGTCCFSDDERLCSKPSLPFTRHCKQHILYNVDQLLFERCTAKSPDSLTQCSNPTFDVDREEPLCDLHVKLQSKEKDELAVEDAEVYKSTRVASSSLPVAQKGRKKTKPMALARPGRRSKKKRRPGNPGKGGNSSIDSVDGSFLSQDSSDATMYNSTSDSCDVSKIDLSSAKFSLADSSLPSSANTVTSVPTRIPSSIAASASQASSIFDTLPIIPPTMSQAGSRTKQRNTRNGQEIPPSLDVGVPNLAPGDEALVASLVADLPPLGGPTEVCADPGPAFVDADLIPDDAFNDLFMDNLKNGDIPSKEEAEALEQALAAVSKDVHNLTVAAAVVSSVGATLPNGSTLNGDAPHYTQPVNGQTPASFHNRAGATTPLNMTETDILGLANNIFGSLTTEQQQQLNGLIDGALASGSLASSPTLKSALASLTNDIVTPLTPPMTSANAAPTSLHPNSVYSGPLVARPVVAASASTTIHNVAMSSPPPYAQYTPPSASSTVFPPQILPSASQTGTGSNLLLTLNEDYPANQVAFPSNNLSSPSLMNGKLVAGSSLSIASMSSAGSGVPVLRTMGPPAASLPMVSVKAGLDIKMS